MAEVTETLLSEKLEPSYSKKDQIDNFLEEKELSVTITLSEYRELVSNKATAKYQIEQVEKDKYERNADNAKLRTRVKELENQLFEYRKKFGDLEAESEE